MSGAAIIKATIGKALCMGVLVTVLDLSTVKALIVAGVSACLTGAWGLYISRDVTRQQRKRDEEIHGRLDTIEDRQKDVAGAVGVKKRHTDPIHHEHDQRSA